MNFRIKVPMRRRRRKNFLTRKIKSTTMKTTTLTSGSE
jgi:hypothetical protein